MQKGILVIFLTFLIFGIALNSPILIADDNNNSGSDDDDENDGEGEGEDEERNKVKLKFEIRRTIVNADGSISKIRIKIEEKIEDGVIKRKIKVRDETKGVRIVRLSPGDTVTDLIKVQEANGEDANP